MKRLVSSIYHQGPSGYDAEQRARHIRAQSCKAWRERGMAMIAVDDLLDDWERQAVTNIANRMYGGRCDGKR